MDYTLTHSLLTKYLATKTAPEEIAKCLSLCGPTVDHLTKLENGDYLYEIEVITNRVDAASAYGIAREAVAILPEFGHKAALKPLDLTDITSALKGQTQQLDIDIVNDPALNRRILALKINNVTIADSPSWLQETLNCLGARPLNNSIDITNYVMWELGHPIHAFDYDRLTKKKIIVREAKKGESFVTLDNQPHTCRGGEVVFDDGTGTIIDLPGIMGTANTAITKDTKNVLLWIESIDPKKIRKASLFHQLRTQAAILNEKSVDPNLALIAIQEAAKLMLEIAKGNLGSQLLDIYPRPVVSKEVNLNLDWLNQFAGVTLEPSKVISILERLGITAVVDPQHQHMLVCTIPTYRVNDINIPEDLVEEIMRIYGYFRLPSRIPQTDLPCIPTDPALQLETAIKRQLVRQGATEVFNISLIGDELLQQTHIDKSTIFSLSNPLSADHIHMRPSLIPSLCQNLQHNKGTYDTPYCLFELANTYRKDPQGDLAIETPTLGIAWSNLSYRQAKGFLEALFNFLHLAPDYHITVIDNKTFVYEVTLDQILKTADIAHRFSKVPEFTPIIEDLTFTLPPKQLVGPVIDAIKKLNLYIAKVDLKDIYTQNYTFTLYYYTEARQLATSDIESVRKQIVKKLEKDYGAKLVGQL